VDTRVRYRLFGRLILHLNITRVDIRVMFLVLLAHFFLEFGQMLGANLDDDSAGIVATPRIDLWGVFLLGRKFFVRTGGLGLVRGFFT
jgi:hypothetical protein